MTARAMSGTSRGRLKHQRFVPERLLITRFHFPINGLAPDLEGLRIVQLSDIHHGPWLPIEVVREIVNHTNELQPDVVVLTGDYVVNSPRYIQPVAEALSELRPGIGTVGVLGNHDWWEGVENVRRAFASVEIPLVDNSRRFISNERQMVTECPPEGLCIAGVGDAWEDEVDFDRALAGVPSHVPRIVLAHNPDCAEDLRLVKTRHRIDLMLSGHTHGGQVCFPRKRTPVLPGIRNNKYAKGLVNGPVCPVFTSQGIGTAGLPVRIAAPPEIAVFELVRANSWAR